MLTMYNVGMSRLNLSFLGTFQATLAQQPITHFRSTNNQGLLVYLALHSEKPVAREVLTAVFWPEESEANARNNLRQSLYQLRKLLGDLDEPTQPYLLVTRQTVQFNPESDFALDVRDFLCAVDAGELETAVTHYHGDLLPGFTCDSLEFENWLRQERETLHALALETMVEAARDCLRKGRYDKAQTIARQQLVLEPWREQAHRQLMQAFALAGDRGNALAQYETCRAVLAEELGVQPAEETITLYEDIKAGRYGPVASADTVRPPVKTRHNLPADITPLIGREVECTRISQLFIEEKQRFVTIVGPGGMGKTRLSIAIGTEMLDHFQAGVYFVDLAPLNEPEEIPQTIASAVNYQAPDNTQDLFPQLLTTLSHQNLFFILDNFEHLLAGATLVTDILQACPDISILVTSRQRLNLASESRFELGGLGFPDWLTPEDALDYTAVQLFVENGRRAKPDFALTLDNVNAIARICQLVQGMPLGLVLAASWLELLSPAEIAGEVEKNLEFLAAELADLPARQRSMQAVFDHSWQMMTPAEQMVLAKLSVFRGGFTREAAEYVANANLRVLLSLVNKSLLQRQAENGRFTTHELLRQFAASQRQRLDADDALLAHCRYFARQIRANSGHAYGLIPTHIPKKFEADRDNLFRAWEYALEQGLAEELLNLAPGIIIFTMRQGTEARTVPNRAIEALRQQGRAETDSIMLYLKVIEQVARQGFDDNYEIIDELLRLLPLLEKESQFEPHFWTHIYIGASHGAVRDPAGSDWVIKAYELAHEMEDEVHINTSDLYRHWLWFFLTENYREATVDHLEDLLVYFERGFSNSIATYMNLFLLGMLHTYQGNFEQAIHYGKRSLNIAKHWQDLLWISISLEGLAETYVQMGLTDEARLQRLDGLEWHLAIGQTWQTLGFLYGEAIDTLELIGDDETSVNILSMAYHHDEVATNYQQHMDVELPGIKERMGQEAFVAAWEKGKAMDFETAVSLFRAALTTEEVPGDYE